MKIRKKCFGRILALMLSVMMVLGVLPTSVFAASGGGTKISDASQLPAEIAEGESYVLTADITLDGNQQIATIAGTLDGQGHTITLRGKALADTVSGTIQNLGVAGTVTGQDEATGSFAMHFSGTIQNCFSTAKISTSGYMHEPGGFVADMTAGKICNSFFAGDAGFGGAFVSEGTVANLSHTVYASGYGGNAAGISGSGQNYNDTHKIGDYDDIASWSEAIEILNREIPDTGYRWVLLEGANLPSLQDKNSVGVNRSALEKAVENANNLASEKDKFTESSWKALEDALAAAKAVPEDADQAAVDAAAKALNNAIGGLVRQRPTKPVKLPDDGSVIEIASADDLSKVGADDSDTTGKYYVLTADITLARGYYNWRTQPFNGVLDGQGHTITFDGASRIFSFADIGEEGVIQNIRFQGKISAQNGAGILGSSLKGAVLNCSSNITSAQGYTASGFARSLDGGVISNCYVTGSPNHAFVATKNSGSIVSSYWEQGIENTVSVDAGSSVVPGSEMRTLDFVGRMNQSRGQYGTQWGQNSDGYPYFGPSLPYTEPGTEPSEYKMTFTPYNGGAPQLLEDGTLTLLLGDTDSFHYAGYLSVKDYSIPSGYKIEWGSNDQEIRANVDDGRLNASKAGEALITATLVDDQGKAVKLLSTLRVTVMAGNIQDIKLYIGGTDVTNGSYTVAGSEWNSIAVRAKYDDGSAEYRDVAYSQFTFVSSDGEYIFKEPQYASFHFEKPGTATITVSYRENPAVKATVRLTSTYVEAKSITPGISGSYTIHGRNANDWQSSPPRFNPEYNGVTIEPSNASYNDEKYYRITSSDPEVGLWFEGGYVPVGAGTVTYRAALTDPETNKTISGSSTVNYQYRNPLSGITLKSSSFTMKANAEFALPIQYAGQKDAEGWNITEPSIDWSYSADGIVEISRKNGNGYWKRDETAPDNNMFVLDTEYMLYALEEGSVTVTGTPRDKTGGAGPITFTVTVSGSEELPVVDIDRIVSEGIASAADYLSDQDMPYIYGSEWLVFALQRAGKSISPEKLNAYYNSAAAEAADWPAGKKPTDIARVSIALTSFGADITDVNGVDLGAMLYNHPNLDRGSNELIYALIALDGAGIEIPEDARWTREKMKDALLAYQKADGGISLDKNGGSGIDITAMALQALAPYKEEAEVSAAIEAALAYLRAELSRPFCGYNTAEAEAQVMIALAELRLDPLKNGFGTRYRNIFSHLENSYQVESGGFSHLAGDEANNMATLQVLQALEAYRRYAAGEKSLWDMAEGGGFTPGPEPGDINITLPDVNGSGITVTGNNGVLTDNMELQVKPVAAGEKYDMVKEVLKTVSNKFLLFDIYLLQNNVKIQPDGSMILSVPVPDGYDGTKCKVFYISDDGNIVTDMNGVYQNGCMVFVTNHFSFYALAQIGTGNSGTDGNGGGTDTPGGSATSPKTGDDRAAALWIIVCLLTVTALAAFTAPAAKKNRRKGCRPFHGNVDQRN